MRNLIRKRLTEYRIDALDNIAVAVNNTKANFAKHGALNSDRLYLFINEHNKTGFAQYIDGSANFIRYVAGLSASQYAGELRDAAKDLQYEIMAKMDRDNFMGWALPGNPERYQLWNELEPALDKFIERKLDDFRLGFIEGKDMNATTYNTVNIVKSSISHAVVQITQSGKGGISRDTAQKLEQIINSEEIKGLPEEDRLDVLDQADDVIKELSAPVTDKGKVYRGLKRLSRFISSVASKTLADFVAQLAVAYAKAHGSVVPARELCLSTGSVTATTTQISVVIEPGASLIHARLRASLANLDEGEFTEGHELDRKWKVAKELVGRRLTQAEAKRLLAKFA